MRNSGKDSMVLIQKIENELKSISKKTTPDSSKILKLIEEIKSIKQKSVFDDSANYKNIFKNLNFSFLAIDKNGIIDLANASILKQLGLTEKKIIGSNIFDLVKFADDTTADNIKKFLKNLSRNKSKELKLNQVLINYKKNKKFISFNLSLKALVNAQDKIVGAIISFDKLQNESKKIDSLTETEKTYSSLVSNLPGFIYRCANDTDWTMEFISEGCKDITGYEPSDFIGNKTLAFNDIIHPDFQTNIWTHWQKILKEKKYFEFEYPIITKNNNGCCIITCALHNKNLTDDLAPGTVKNTVFVCTLVSMRSKKISLCLY